MLSRGRGRQVWPLAHTINFRFIPSSQRVLYINSIQARLLPHATCHPSFRLRRLATASSASAAARGCLFPLLTRAMRAWLVQIGYNCFLSIIGSKSQAA